MNPTLIGEADAHIHGDHFVHAMLNILAGCLVSQVTKPSIVAWYIIQNVSLKTLDDDKLHYIVYDEIFIDEMTIKYLTRSFHIT